MVVLLEIKAARLGTSVSRMRLTKLSRFAARPPCQGDIEEQGPD